MRERQTRLARLVRLFELARQASETRLARLSNEDSALAQRETNLLAAMSSSNMCGLALHQMYHQRISTIAVERKAIGGEIDMENARRLDTERRGNAAARSLDRVDAQIKARAERLDLEEIRLKLGAHAVSPRQAPSR